MANRIEEIQVLFQKRNARARGPTSSAQQNDMGDELAHDLASLNEQWNERLVPLTSVLPNGSPDSSVDAFTDGLDGKTLYVDSEATSIFHSIYYNTTQIRPRTVYEQFVNVYETIETAVEQIESKLATLVPSASQIAISDNVSLYTATNVEDALAEVMLQVSLISAAFGADTISSDLVLAEAIGIGTTSPETSAAIEVSSTTKALLLSRMTTTQRDNLVAVDGMIIYNLTTNKFQGRANSTWVDLH